MREDWIETEIISVANLYQPKTISSKMLVENGKYAVYGANGIIGCHHKYNHEEAEFLITCRGATCGNVHITKPYSWINGNAMVVQPFKKQLLSLSYLKYVFTNKGRVQKAISGSAQPQITRTTLSPIRIPLAPLPEQRAIVGKIEELFSELDKGEEDLKKAQEQLKIYRQAVLKKAFEGDWDKVELGSVCDKVLKVKRKEMPLDTQLLYLDIGGIDNVKNKIVDHKEFNWENAPSRAQQIVKVGDILFSTVRTYLKNIARVEKPIYENEIASSGFTVIRGKTGVLNSKYIFYLTTSQFFLEPLNELQRGTSYPAVRDKDVFSQLIPLPNIPDQENIVQEIESRLSVCDSIEDSIHESLNKSKALRQSILKKAFEGTLLSEEEIAACKAAPDYEPASVLLERIKAEKKKN